MATKIKSLFSNLKNAVAQTNLLSLSFLLLFTGAASILVLKSYELQKSRRLEIQANQFAFSRNLAQKLFVAERELAALLVDSPDDERIYHNDILLDHAKNGAFNETGINEIARLRINNSGRFKAVDGDNRNYSPKAFSLQSFPVQGSPLHWLYNSKTASGLFVVPTRSEVLVANIPVAWFANILKLSQKIAPTKSRGLSPRETFDWAIVYAPSELEKKSLKEEQNRVMANPEGTNPQPAPATPAARAAAQQLTQSNFVLSSSDSVLFRQTLSAELLSSGILDGPARYLNTQGSLTEQSALAVVPVEKSNLRLLTKWTSRWSFQDIMIIHSNDFWLLLILCALFFLSNVAFKMKFSRLTGELRNALVELNPSNASALTSGPPRRLERMFAEIFESAVWLYRIASQRQQKYSALAQIFKSIVSNDNVFLVHVNEGVTTPLFHLTVDANSRWNICLLRSPYVQNQEGEILFAVAGDVALAKIFMMLASHFYLENSANGVSLESLSRRFFDTIDSNSGPITISSCWMEFSADSFAKKDVSAYFQSNTDVLKMDFDDGVVTLTDTEDIKAFRFEQPDKVSTDAFMVQFKPSGELT